MVVVSKLQKMAQNEVKPAEMWCEPRIFFLTYLSVRALYAAYKALARIYTRKKILR